MQKPRIRISAATGSALGAALFVLIALVRTGLTSGMGFGTIGDPLVVIGLFLATTAVLGTLIWVGFIVVRRLPAWVTVLLAGAAGAGVLILRPRDDVLLHGVVLIAGIGLSVWVGAAIGRVVQLERARRRGSHQTSRNTRAWVHAAAALCTCLAVSVWVFRSPASASGEELPISAVRTVASGQPSLPDPSARGPYAIESFTYGSGTDRRRRAYRDEVVLSTLSQDLRPLLPEFRGLEARLHRSYWGFGLEAVPLNATVWMPRADGQFPVVLFIHGIDPTSERSELGYAYLGELLASRGYVFIAADMNFLGSPHIARTSGEMPVRAWLALKHLDLLKEWREAHPGGRADRIDVDRILVGGHSRGGEAAVLAATLNGLQRYPPNAAIPLAFGHAIRGVFALAPTDQLYPLAGQGTRLSNISYLVVHGSHDVDVPSFVGMAQYQRISLAEGSPAFKTAVYVVGANHSNFNAHRNGRDLDGIGGRLLDASQVLSGEDQRRMASAFVSAFADAVLRGNDRDRALFRDTRTGASFLPRAQVLSRFQDGWTRTIVSFEEDVDPVTTTLPGATIESGAGTVWREEPLTLRGIGETSPYTQVARIQWHRNAANGSVPSWEVRLPADVADELVHPSEQLRFSMIRRALASKLPDVSVELETSDGVRARVDAADFAPPPPAERPRIWRIPGLDALTFGEPEEILQDYAIPLDAIRSIEPAFDPTRISAIRFVFDRTPSGSVFLDDIGFRRPAPSSSVDGSAADRELQQVRSEPGPHLPRPGDSGTAAKPKNLPDR